MDFAQEALPITDSYDLYRFQYAIVAVIWFTARQMPSLSRIW